MTDEHPTRRLAAILAADVVGYSRLMAAEEAGTLATLKARRKAVLEPLVARHHGRVFKIAGDGVLVEFASAVNAVQCAVELQQAFAAANADMPEDRRIVIRVGVHVGDVMVEGADLYGEGVNVAARLEAITEPGRVLVSEDAHRQVKNKLGFGFDDLGPRTLKNIAESLRVYRVAGEAPVMIAKATASPVSDKPSIAILPFTNMSGDPEQEYFSDGITEDIITELSRWRSLMVIARNSSFIYKSRNVDVKQVGRELGVRYVLEGSVRKAGPRLRITGQLIDTATGAHLWADRFDGALEDVFDFQDRVTGSVVGAIVPKVEQAEIERQRDKPTESLAAYDYFLRGMAAVNAWGEAANLEAVAHFRRAIELDPNFASAYGMAARCYSQRKAAGWVKDAVSDAKEAQSFASRAIELGKDDALALATAGMAIGYVVGDLDDGAAFIDQALSLNPNLAWAWLFAGYVSVWRGEPERAVECVTRAMQLSPQDAQLFNMQVACALAHFVAGRFDVALTWAEKAVRGHPNYIFANSTVAACAALAGRPETAAKALDRLRQLRPNLRIGDVIDVFPLRHKEHHERWIDGLRRAGLPE